jgi:hypothetical protein
VVVKWFRPLVELLVVLSGNSVTDSSFSVNEARERKRKRAYEAWQKKHGSKGDKES